MPCLSTCQFAQPVVANPPSVTKATRQQGRDLPHPFQSRGLGVVVVNPVVIPQIPRDWRAAKDFKKPARVRPQHGLRVDSDRRRSAP